MNFLKLLFELYKAKRKTEMSVERMGKLQRKRLRKILHYAYCHSRYYREKINESGIGPQNIDTVPLDRFPSLDKKELMENFDSLVTVSDLTQKELRRFDEYEKKDRRPFRSKYHIVHSSGSTGKPGYFVYDKRAWNTMLVGIIRAALWDMSIMQILKLLAEKPRIAYIAATDGRYGGAMAVGDGIEGVGAGQLCLDVKSPLSEWISSLRKFNPNMIIGYPSAVKILGGLVERGEIRLGIKRIVTCGEPLGAGLRRYLERTFDTKVVNFYGASESLAIGVENDTEEGMLLFDDMNVIEVRDGNMYLTSLYNFTQPLIRYRLTDKMTLEKPGGECPFTRAVGLLGRNEDILWFEDSAGKRDFLHPLAVEGICIEGLVDYQFVQYENDYFEMHAQISASDALKYEIKDELIKRLKFVLDEKKLNFVRFEVRFTDAIFPDPLTGKKRLIVSMKRSENTREAV